MKGKPYYEHDFNTGTCIVMGNEGQGVRNNIRQHCDDTVSIPMKNNVESLNVSVSAAIIMFEVMKQRNKG